MIKGTNNISEQIYQLSILQQTFVHEQLKKLGLNEMQARTIYYVFTYPGAIQKDLAQYLGKQDATITNILKLLEKSNYIKREIPADNERQKKLYLTENGEKSVELIQKIFQDLEYAMSSSLNASEIKDLKEELKKIIDHFR